jgi:hypothetical protein
VGSGGHCHLLRNCGLVDELDGNCCGLLGVDNGLLKFFWAALGHIFRLFAYRGLHLLLLRQAVHVRSVGEMVLAATWRVRGWDTATWREGLRAVG